MILNNTKIIPQILFVLISFVCSGQTTPPPPPSDDLIPPVGLPIDEGLIILKVIGLAFGLYVLYKANKRAVTN